MGTAAQVRITRGGHLESTHHVHAVVTSGGRSLLEYGDPIRLAFMRSSAKPLQSLPLVEDGVLESVYSLFHTFSYCVVRSYLLVETP